MITANVRERLKKQVEEIIRRYSSTDINLILESIDETLVVECGPNLDHEVFAILEELVLEEKIELASNKIIWRGS